MIDAQGRSWRSQLPDDDEELEYDDRGKLRWKGHPRKYCDHELPSKRYQGLLLGTKWTVDAFGLIRSQALRKTRLMMNFYGAEKVMMGELSLLGKSFMIPELLFSQRVHREASSNLGSGAAQQELTATHARMPFPSTRISILLAHMGAIRHTGTSMPEQVKCYASLVRYVFQVAKWKRVALASIRRQGVGGGGKRILDAARRTARAT